MEEEEDKKTHPEQKLVGIENTTEYTEKIRNILSKMKGQAAVTADTETASSLDEEEIPYFSLPFFPIHLQLTKDVKT